MKKLLLTLSSVAAASLGLLLSSCGVEDTKPSEPKVPNPTTLKPTTSSTDNNSSVATSVARPRTEAGKRNIFSTLALQNKKELLAKVEKEHPNLWGTYLKRAIETLSPSDLEKSKDEIMKETISLAVILRQIDDQKAEANKEAALDLIEKQYPNLWGTYLKRAVKTLTTEALLLPMDEIMKKATMLGTILRQTDIDNAPSQIALTPAIEIPQLPTYGHSSPEFEELEHRAPQTLVQDPNPVLIPEWIAPEQVEQALPVMTAQAYMEMKYPQGPNPVLTIPKWNEPARPALTAQAYMEIKYPQGPNPVVTIPKWKAPKPVGQALPVMTAQAYMEMKYSPEPNPVPTMA